MTRPKRSSCTTALVMSRVRTKSTAKSSRRCARLRRPPGPPPVDAFAWHLSLGKTLGAPPENGAPTNLAAVAGYLTVLLPTAMNVAFESGIEMHTLEPPVRRA